MNVAVHNAVVAPPLLLVKKYPNRRLYDTTESRYITVDDLSARIKAGSDVLVQDATTGADLTQQILTQIILESRGGARLLPVPLLLRLIRLGDEALAEFFGRYVSWALELYTQARSGARALMPLNPLAQAPFAATDALARLVLGAAQWASPGSAPPPMPIPHGSAAPPPPSSVDLLVPEPPPSEPSVPPATPPATTAGVADDVARLREELEALKAALNAPKKRAAAKKKR
ncbi:MAG: hypothetical protein JWP97_2858 [Labilithrix sp.]|nr:hypothetical protein [Labilithrix sp.]